MGGAGFVGAHRYAPGMAGSLVAIARPGSRTPGVTPRGNPKRPLRIAAAPASAKRRASAFYHSPPAICLVATLSRFQTLMLAMARTRDASSFSS
jgi:hypothetical protein